MRKTKGFTLVEMVVVVMILGILAAIAVPKLLKTSQRAKDQGVKQTLSVVRTAIEQFTADNEGTLPGQDDDLPEDLAPYLRGDFPTSPVGSKDAKVAYTTGSGLTADSNPAAGWKYSTDTGEFIINSDAATVVDPSVAYDKL